MIDGRTNPPTNTTSAMHPSATPLTSTPLRITLNFPRRSTGASTRTSGRPVSDSPNRIAFLWLTCPSGTPEG